MPRQWIALFVFFFISFNVSSETFEQAYAPIAVGDITIFIPIDRQPALPPSLSIKASGSQYLLEWNGDGATRYKVEHLVNGIWVLLADSISTPSYQTSINNGPNFRVSACDRYGCSGWRPVNNIINSPLQIRSFNTNNYLISSSSSAIIAWDVTGASKVSVRSSHGQVYQNLKLKGKLSVSTSSITSFTLTAEGFGGRRSQKLTIVKPLHQTRAFAANVGTYLQPLLNVGINPIQRSLLTGENHHNYVADMQHRLHRITDNGEVIWSRKVNGLIANKPLLIGNWIYYTVSHLDGKGEVCKLNINNDSVRCHMVNNAAISGPVNFEPSDNTMYVIDVSGIVYEFDITYFDTIKQITDLHLARNTRVLTTPAMDPKLRQMIVRTEDNSIIAVELFNRPKNVANKLMPYPKSKARVRPRAMSMSNIAVAVPIILQGNNAAATSNVPKVKWTKKLD